MIILSSILSWILKKRIQDVELFIKNPFDVQESIILQLIQKSKDTEYGRRFSFTNLNSVHQFQQKVPLNSYDDLFPYIERMMKGEQNLIWPTETRWFAKSSGTTNTRSKFIPVSPEALEDCHYKAGKDLLSIYVNNHPDTNLFGGKSLAVGGSHQVNELSESKSYYGDVSAVLMKNLPFWAEFLRTPSLETALMSEWEAKIDQMARETAEEDVTNLSGVPTWTLILIQKVLELKGAEYIHDVWPNLEAFFHGAVSFVPYREIFDKLASKGNLNYYETYNATEGFFGIQDRHGSDEMLLMLDYGIFYEFIPVEEVDKSNPTVITLDQVECGKTYAMVITTNAGLWRYKIGDTITFTSLKPFRIKIAGRTKHFINAFGEELHVANAEKAITIACSKTDSLIENFTAGPRYFNEKMQGSHEWIIEFSKAPADLHEFTRILDGELRKLNSDYDAKRYKDIALQEPIIHSVEVGTFYNWMKKRGKLGGQNKVPRLSNNREFLDDILNMLKAKA